MFIAALANSQQPKSGKAPNIHELMDKVRYVHAAEYYLAIKRNEILMRATAWRSLENITLGTKKPKSPILWAPFM